MADQGVMSGGDQAPAGAPAAATSSRATHLRVLIGSLSGSSIEWFDFFLFVTAAGLVFDDLFFPTEDKLVSLMLAYLTVSLTFFIRPLGGVIFSHIGDRIGRKKTLVITLSLMGGSTVAIGLLPTFEQVGIWAPIMLILLRIIQGAAIGGEWGGALLLAYEYAPKNRRGLFGSVPQMGITIGMLLAALALGIVSQLPDDQFNAWGWRLPFLASVLLVFVGLWIRNGVAETPAFAEAKRTGEVAKLPIVETLRDHWRAVLVAVGAKIVETAPFYIFATFVISYTTETLDYNRSQALTAVTIAAAIATVTIPLMGLLSDFVGRKALYLTGAALIGFFAIPYFVLLNLDTSWALILASIIGLGLLWPPVTATIGTMTSEIFSTRVRYTGVTLGYQIGAALAGGTAPLLATYLLSRYNNAWMPIAIYLILTAVISFAAVMSVSRAQVRTDEPEPALA